MFTEYINRILESERDFGSNRQEEVTTPDVIEKVVLSIKLYLKNTKKILKLSVICMEKILKPVSVLILHYRRL